LINNIIIFVIACLIIMFALCIVRAVQSKTVADRMVAVNVATTMTTVIIAAIAVLSGEDSFIDVAFVYAILSFLAVLVFTRVFIGTYRAKYLREKAEAEAAQLAAENSGAEAALLAAENAGKPVPGQAPEKKIGSLKGQAASKAPEKKSGSLKGKENGQNG